MHFPNIARLFTLYKFISQDEQSKMNTLMRSLFYFPSNRILHLWNLWTGLDDIWSRNLTYRYFSAVVHSIKISVRNNTQFSLRLLAVIWNICKLIRSSDYIGLIHTSKPKQNPQKNFKYRQPIQCFIEISSGVSEMNHPNGQTYYLPILRYYCELCAKNSWNKTKH